MRQLTSTLVACCILVAATTSANAQSKRQIIQVSKYQMETKEQADKFDSMMKPAIKALNGVGVKNIGVFKLADQEKAKENPHMRVVIAAYKSLQQRIDSEQEAFMSNQSFFSEAEDYLTAEPDEKPFKRIDTMLLYAFTGMPEMKVPGSGEGKTRLFELRTYESYSEMTAIIKVEMFNDGEIELFEKVGLPAVFYGSAVAGGNLPQLTYMLVHDDKESQDIGWKKFIKSPEWAALQKKDPYAGKKLVSKIEKTMLVPTDYSQVK